MLKASKNRLRGFVFLLLLFFSLTSPWLLEVVGFPCRVRVIEGSPLNLDIWVPFETRLLSSVPGMFGFDGNPIDESGLTVKGRTVSLESLQCGQALLEFRALGILPVRRFLVDVVPEVKLVPGGHAIGVLLSSHGVVVVGHARIRGIDGHDYYPARDAGIEVGDILTAINGSPINSVDDVERLVTRGMSEGTSLSVELLRGGKGISTLVTPVPSEQRTRDGAVVTKFRLGIYVRDNAAGVGTLTFFDPKTHRYGALGHEITDSASRRTLEIPDGRIVEAFISGVQAGVRGQPGEKIGTFEGTRDIIGTIEKNTELGIFGRLKSQITNPFYRTALPVALASEVKEGPAEMLTVIEGREIERFDIEIVKVMRQTRPNGKGLIIRVTDPRLVETTGGIVQGMSGSPIIQNGKLVAAVTHVFTSDTQKGYAVHAYWMAEEAGLTAENVPASTSMPFPGLRPLGLGFERYLGAGWSWNRREMRDADEIPACPEWLELSLALQAACGTASCL